MRIDMPSSALLSVGLILVLDCCLDRDAAIGGMAGGAIPFRAIQRRGAKQTIDSNRVGPGVKRQHRAQPSICTAVIPVIVGQISGPKSAELRTVPSAPGPR